MKTSASTKDDARAQQSLFQAIKPARSITETCRIAIEFTVAHDHEYELVAKDWGARLSRKELLIS